MNANYDVAVMIAGQYMYDRFDFETYRQKKYHGWGPAYGKDSDLDWKYNRQQNSNAEMYGAAAVLLIEEKVLMDCNRINDKLIQKSGGTVRCLDSDYARLIEIMSAAEPETGIFHNEFCDRAYARIEKIRAANHYYDTW